MRCEISKNIYHFKRDDNEFDSEITIDSVSVLDGELDIAWSGTKLGFGHLTLYRRENGWRLDTEAMGPAFAKVVMGALVDFVMDDKENAS